MCFLSVVLLLIVKLGVFFLLVRFFSLVFKVLCFRLLWNGFVVGFFFIWFRILVVIGGSWLVMVFCQLVFIVLLFLRILVLVNILFRLLCIWLRWLIVFLSLLVCDRLKFFLLVIVFKFCLSYCCLSVVLFVFILI